MICAFCGEETPNTPCSGCGRDPLLMGRYRLQRLLGQGAVGTTYAAQRLETGEVVAIKEMLLRRAETDKARELLEREVALLRQLQHPGIPTHIDDFLAGRGKHRALYLVQEYIDGRPLSTVLADHRFDETEVLTILDALLEILDYLHTLRPPVIHRDLKPDNVMQRRDGTLVLIDFGSARDAVKDPDLGGSTVAGTFGYMAPEQFAGDATPATDLYALGVLAAVLLTRQEPRAMADRGTLTDWLTTAHVSLPLQGLILALTAADPIARPASVSAVQQRIRQLCAPPRASPPAPAPVVSVAPDVSRPRPRAPQPRPPAALAAPPPESSGGCLLVTVGLVLLVLIGALLVLSGAPRPASVSSVPPVEPSSQCGDQPCQPLSEGQLKGVRLGMNFDEAVAAFPALQDAEAQDPQRIHATTDILDPGAFLETMQFAVTLPGAHRALDTTLLDQPARCDFQFAVGDQASRMHCTLLNTSPTEDTHQRLTDAIGDRLTAQYGAGLATEASEAMAFPNIVDRDWGVRWSADGDTLVLASTFDQFMGMSPTSTLEVTFTSRAHAALVARLQEQAQQAYREARALEQRQAAEEVRRLETQLADPGAGSGDL
ncbi:MAG: serine/threonine protein kinase [Myxococcota bacterium]|jgi:serine/threonine protein kinase